jgi:hypothetical protein
MGFSQFILPLRTDYIKLFVSFTDDYPEDAIPELDFVASSDALQDRLDSMKCELVDLARESIGAPVIFTLVSHLKERLDQFSEIESNCRVSMAEKERQQIEAIENAKFQGAPVTRESFKEWKQRFDSESRTLHEVDKNSVDKKLTGRQLFESDKDAMVFSDRNYAEEGEVAVDISLFEREMYNLDLTDESNSDTDGIITELSD